MADDLQAFVRAAKNKLGRPVLNEPGVLFLAGEGAVPGQRLTCEQWESRWRDKTCLAAVNRI